MFKPEETKDSYLRLFVSLWVFSVAMGILEAIVVVYLRELYYPAGFQFPLQPIPQKIFLTEILREVCTIVMLIAVAAVVTKNFYLRLSSFLFTFGLWDIFYYIGLKTFLDWPPSLTTWDILFLIPVTWTGPVLSPLISSITMISLGLLILHLHIRYGMIRTGFPACILIGFGVFLIFLTYIWDSAKIILEGGFLSDISGLLENPEYQKRISSYVPERYNWFLFALGELLIISGIFLVYKRTSTPSQPSRSRSTLISQ